MTGWCLGKQIGLADIKRRSPPSLLPLPYILYTSQNAKHMIWGLLWALYNHKEQNLLKGEWGTNHRRPFHLTKIHPYVTRTVARTTVFNVVFCPTLTSCTKQRWHTVQCYQTL